MSGDHLTGFQARRVLRSSISHRRRASRAGTRGRRGRIEKQLAFTPRECKPAPTFSNRRSSRPFRYARRPSPTTGLDSQGAVRSSLIPCRGGSTEPSSVPEHGLAGRKDEKIFPPKIPATGLPVIVSYGETLRPRDETQGASTRSSLRSGRRPSGLTRTRNMAIAGGSRPNAK